MPGRLQRPQHASVGSEMKAVLREGRLRLIATLHDPAVIRKLLAHLGIARPGPAPPESGGVAP